MNRPVILALQHAPQEPFGTLGWVLADEGFQIREVHVYAGAAVPEDLGGVAGLVVMGGPMGVYEADRYPFLAQELRLIESALATKTPVLGICLGCQLLAAALGGRVFPSGRRELPEAGADPLFSDVPAELMAFHWHGDTYDLPCGAERLASSAMTAEQGFRYRSFAYGLQFHLEVTAAIVNEMAISARAELDAFGIDVPPLIDGARRWGGELEVCAEAVVRQWARLAR